MGKRFTNRGVSVIIAALLLIAIAVAAAVLLYVFSIGLLGSLQGSGGQQTKQQLIMEAYNWLTLNAPTFSMRNVGTAGVSVADVFVSGVAAGFSGCATVAVQTACTITVASYGAGTPTITNGVAYTVKIVTIDGGVFSYSAIAGQAS